MPRKKSKRKKIQDEKRAQQPNGDHRGVKTIALVNAGTAGLAMAASQAVPSFPLGLKMIRGCGLMWMSISFMSSWRSKAAATRRST